MKIRMQHGFHFGAGHNELDGWGEWWRDQNNAGIPVNAIGADNAGPLWEIQNGGYADNILIWRRSLWDGGFDPNSPDYNAVPEAEAARMLAYKYDNLWPPELHRLFCFLKNCNEIRTHTGEGDTWYDDMEPGQWWGRYALAAAKFATERDYRVVLLSPSSADHDYDFWMQPAMLEFLRYAADHKSNVMVGLHEYSYVARNLFAMIGDDDATVEDVLGTQPDEYWKLKVGRFRMLFEACDRAGIGDWPMIYMPEWGWALDSIPSTGAALEQIVAAHTKIYGPYYRYIAGMGTWYLGPGYGNNIARDTNALILPCAAFAIENEIEVQPAFPADGTPTDPDPPDPPPSEKLALVNFTGWGWGDDQLPVGWQDSDECPYVQIPYAIGDNGRFPMHYEGWDGENPYNPDGKEWNDYSCPEAVVMWADMLPPEEHGKYLNSDGRTYHWFSPQKAARSRFYAPVYLEVGTYKLTLEFYGDFSMMVDGEKRPQADPQHGQVELFIGSYGRDDMIGINLLGENKISREFDIVSPGEYQAGYGILSRYAAGGGGTAGVFLKGFSIERVDEAPPVDLPHIVIVKKPQISEFSIADNQWVSEWAYENYGRTTTHSLDDMAAMLRSGNPVTSYAVVVNPDDQADVVAWLTENGYTWQRLDLPGQPDTDFQFTHWPTLHRYITQEFLANPDDYIGFGFPGHEGLDIRAYHGDPVFSVADGTVSYVNDNPAASNYGIYIRVRHTDNYETTYAHLKEAVRSVGETVRGGDVIGLADNTGNSTGSHLHLTLKQNGVVFVDRCGNTWPYNICDPTPYMEVFDNTTWPGGSPGFPCPGEPPPAGKEINLRHYQVGIPTAFRVVKHVDNNGHETNEDVQDMWIDDNTVVMRKNQNGEWYRFEGDYRERMLDTSPGPDSQGTQRVYRMTQGGTVGGRVNPSTINEGNRWTDSTSHHVQFYAKDGCRELSENSGDVVSACEARLEKNVTFNAHGQNITFDEVVYVMTNNGEEQMYGVYQGQVVGWIGWIAAWGRSEPVEVHFDRGIMTQEPNRHCSW